MNRNSNARFELAPQVDIERSTFDMSFNVKTSYDVGELVPFMVSEILPGDSFRIDTSKVARLQTLITPVMDNLYLDTYYFFVPNRLVWEHWQNFCGEDTPNAWINDPQYSVPQIEPPVNGWNIGTIADYFGLPTGLDGMTFNALPFRAYAKIVDDWFRDENLMYHPNIPLGEATISGSNGSNYVTDLVKGGRPFVACKFHDYFTSCLPKPFKAVSVGLLDGLAPVYPADLFTSVENDKWIEHGTNQLRFGVNESINQGEDEYNLVNNQALGVYGDEFISYSNLTSQIVGSTAKEITPVNLWADLSGNSTFTINDLRQAFQIQRLLEKDARGGTRYIELLKAHFGIESPDSRLQRSEYLGGNRVPLNIEQVTQTSSTDNTSPLGSQAGWSQTNDTSYDVNKSFTEHGFIIGLMCCRYDHTYQQGVERMWKRENRFDYYWPALAHIGEKPVYHYEIDATYWADHVISEESVFGYQEAWSEYKYKPNYVTGQMRSAADNSLDIWHFADYYDDNSATDPVQLSASWIQEDKTNIDRALSVTSANANQIFIDIFVDCTVTRPMPLYSIPGMVDHF